MDEKARKMIEYLDQLVEVGKCVCEHYGSCRVNDEDCPFYNITKDNCFANQVAQKIVHDKNYRKKE